MMDWSWERPIPAQYRDPVDLVWIRAAARMGLLVRESDQVYASTDGAGTLTLAAPAGRDPDDCLAQMVFHEICHWITNGRHTLDLPDWGFALDGDFDWREHSCLRLQAWLASHHGLGQVLAPTTLFRPYYDALGADPMGPVAGDWPHEDQVLALAHAARDRSGEAPWAQPLQDALVTTARIRDLVLPHLPDPHPLPSLWGR